MAMSSLGAAGLQIAAVAIFPISRKQLVWHWHSEAQFPPVLRLRDAVDLVQLSAKVEEAVQARTPTVVVDAKLPRLRTEAEAAPER